MEKNNLNTWFKDQSWISKSLFLVFLISLTAGLYTLQMASKIHIDSYTERNSMVSKITEIIKDKEILSQQETKEIEQIVNSYKNKYQHYQYFALYSKENQLEIPISLNANLEHAQYLHPQQAEKKIGIVADSFYTTEAIETEKWHIVQQYNPDGGYYYVTTILVLAISGLSLIIWLSIQVQQLLRIRKLKFT